MVRQMLQKKTDRRGKFVLTYIAEENIKTIMVDQSLYRGYPRNVINEMLWEHLQVRTVTNFENSYQSKRG